MSAFKDKSNRRNREVNRVRSFIAIFGLVGFGFVLTASAEVTAVRTLSWGEYWPGLPVRVTITVSTDTDTLQVVETPPTGWAISDFTPINGTVNAGVIAWTVSRAPVPRSFSYTTTPPATETGEVVFSGKVNDKEITGTTTMTPVTSKSLGIFQYGTSIEDRAAGWWSEGAGWYYPSSGEYIIINRGNADDGEQHTPHHFLYSEVTGDFSIEARIIAVNLHGLGGHDVAFISVLDTLTPDSMFCVVCHWCDEDAFAGWRQWTARFPLWSDTVLPRFQDGRLKIVRENNICSAYYFNTVTMEWTLLGSQVLDLTDPVYVGLSAMGGPSRFVMGHFSDVRLITASACDDWDLYK